MTTPAWQLAHGQNLPFGDRARIVGILNVTPDSFSDGGRFGSPDDAVAAALAMIDAGASMVDVGGESTRPGAEPVSALEEQRRLLPVVEALAARGGVIMSVDTYRAETARLALKAGAHALNDVWGLQREPELARLAADEGAGLIIMHTARDRTPLPDVVADQLAYLGQSLKIAAAQGVERDQIVLDPGFGFGKDTTDNLNLMARFAELGELGYPLLAGTSRKRFLGRLTGREAVDRDVATAATSVALRLAGASLFRVHDVAANADALKVADAILAMSGKG